MRYCFYFLFRRIYILPTLLFLSSCATSSNLCEGFTDWVEPTRAEYFPKHRVYPLNAEHRRLALRYQPRLVMHPQGTPPIDFADYLKDAELVAYGNDDGDDSGESLNIGRLKRMSYEEQCQTYIKAKSDTVVSRPPYPWYVQVFADEGPGGESDWLYLKYNIVFDWSGLAQHISPSAKVGVRFLGATPDKWHRLDVHTAVVIGLDDKRRQRLITISQHNYARTYLAGPEFDAGQPVTIAIALRSNEPYLDKSGGTNGKQLERVVRFYNDLPYLITGENRPRYSGHDEIAGVNSGGVPLEMRLEFISPDYPLASYAGLLAPPQRLFGSIYIGRDGPMGYDYFAPPSAFKMPRGASLGYWQPGNRLLLEELQPVMERMKSFRSEEDTWNSLLDILERNLAEDLLNYLGLVAEQTKIN